MIQINSWVNMYVLKWNKLKYLLTTCFQEIANPNFEFSVIFSQTRSFEKATIKQTRLTLIGWKNLENPEYDIGIF